MVLSTVFTPWFCPILDQTTYEEKKKIKKQTKHGSIKVPVANCALCGYFKQSKERRKKKKAFSSIYPSLNAKKLE